MDFQEIIADRGKATHSGLASGAQSRADELFARFSSGRPDGKIRGYLGEALSRRILENSRRGLVEIRGSRTAALHL